MYQSPHPRLLLAVQGVLLITLLYLVYRLLLILGGH